MKISILDKEYSIQCEPDEKEKLFKAAVYVDTEIRKISDTENKQSTESIAILTALNLANQILTDDERPL